mmetsp:Transcript_4250/g.15280  ORF Transcript_4250/g.15280 Transcript_4250/m.15280 type:complete len:1645 (+) Transcript_4250:199-5133(+)
MESMQGFAAHAREVETDRALEELARLLDAVDTLAHTYQVTLVPGSFAEAVARAGEEGGQARADGVAPAAARPALLAQNLHRISYLVEEEEAKYTISIGDTSERVRLLHPVGRMQGLLRDRSSGYDVLWQDLTIPSRSHTIDSNVKAGIARYTLAVTSFQFQYPLDDEAFFDEVCSAAKLDALQDAAHDELEALCDFALRTYCIGLVARALINEDVCQDLISSSYAQNAMRYVASAVLGPSPGQPEGTDGAVATKTPFDKDWYLADPGGSENLDFQRLRLHRLRYCVQVVAQLGEYPETLASILPYAPVDVVMEMLRPGMATNIVLLLEALYLAGVLLGYRKLAVHLIDAGILKAFLLLPRMETVNEGIAFCLIRLQSVSQAVDLVSGCHAPLRSDLMALVLGFISSGNDATRRDTAMFVATAFQFPTLLAEFDRQQGAPKLVILLRTILLARNESAHTNAARHVIFHTCHAIRQYLRASFVVFVECIKQRVGSASSEHKGARLPLRHVELSTQAVDVMINSINSDKRVATVFARQRLTVAEEFLEGGGVAVMLEIIKELQPGEKYALEICQACLGAMHILTLFPSLASAFPKVRLQGASFPSGSGGGTVPEQQAQTSALGPLIALASRGSHSDPGVLHMALAVIANCVTSVRMPLAVPPSKRHRALNAGSARKGGEVAEPGGHNEDGKAGHSGGATKAHATADGARQPSSGAAVPASELQSRNASRKAAFDVIREQGGIKILLSLLQYRNPPSVADSMRALAVTILVGLAEDQNIAQILGKLHIGRQLSELARQPVYSGASGAARSANASIVMEGSNAHAAWHAFFSSQAMKLITRTELSGTQVDGPGGEAANLTMGLGRSGRVPYRGNDINMMMDKTPASAMDIIERAAISASTPITYHARELLSVVHEHLVANGLHRAASVLEEEADLKTYKDGCDQIGARSLGQHSWPSNSNAMLALLERRARLSQRRARLQATRAQKEACAAGSTVPSSETRPVSESGPKKKSGGTPTGAGSRPRSDPAAPRTSPLSGMKRPADRAGAKPGIQAQVQSPLPRVKRLAPYLNGPTSSERSPTPALASPKASARREWNPSEGTHTLLDKIVTSNLRQQHRQSQHPISTLPPLSLHSTQFPASREPWEATNFCLRHRIFEYGTGLKVPSMRCLRKRERRHVYGRFQTSRIYRDDMAQLATVAIAEPFLAAGSMDGEVSLFNINTGHVVAMYGADAMRGHSHAVKKIVSAPGQRKAASGEPLLLSSSRAEVVLWDSGLLDDGGIRRFDGCRDGRFDQTGDRIVAIRDMDSGRSKIVLFDAATGRLTSSFASVPSAQMGYPATLRSMATFSPDNNLVLWGDMLWDSRVPTDSLHSFDQFSEFSSSCFHPAGNEVIVNSEVWDLRTYKLLHSVPSLEGTVLSFSYDAKIIYAHLRRNTASTQSILHPRSKYQRLHTTFMTMDSRDYSEIALVEVERCVLDMAIHPNDTQVAVAALESTEGMDFHVKLLDVGRQRLLQDESDDEGDEDSMMSESEEGSGLSLTSASSDGDDEDLDDDDPDGDLGGADEDEEGAHLHRRRERRARMAGEGRRGRLLRHPRDAVTLEDLLGAPTDDGRYPDTEEMEGPWTSDEEHSSDGLYTSNTDSDGTGDGRAMYSH